MTPSSEEIQHFLVVYDVMRSVAAVEEFGTERVARLTGEEIVARVEDLQRITTFASASVAMR